MSNSFLGWHCWSRLRLLQMGREAVPGNFSWCHPQTRDVTNSAKSSEYVLLVAWPLCLGLLTRYQCMLYSHITVISLSWYMMSEMIQDFMWYQVSLNTLWEECTTFCMCFPSNVTHRKSWFLRDRSLKSIDLKYRHTSLKITQPILKLHIKSLQTQSIILGGICFLPASWAKNSTSPTQEAFLRPWLARTLESGLSIENPNGMSGLQSPSWPGSQKCLWVVINSNQSLRLQQNLLLKSRSLWIWGDEAVFCV